MKLVKKSGWLSGILCCTALSACTTASIAETTTLKSALHDKFLIGTALNAAQFTGKDTLAVHVVQQHFDAIVAENCMKSEVIQPVEGQFDFAQADQFVAFGEANQLVMTGHTLIWHSQTPPWLFVDAEGKDVSREVLIERMKKHITALVSRYKGKLKGWDVVNEAFLDDGSYRPSKFYTIIGEDFIPLAFQFAHAADPDAELYYNDYSMASEGKRKAVVNLVKSLQAQGIRIDAVGMQGHAGMNYPDLNEFEKSLVAYSGTGAQVMITELDLTVLPTPNPEIGADVSATFEYQQEMNPYPTGLPAAVDSTWTNRYNEFFNLFLKHSDKISRVTVWGVSDANTWRNDWPIPGRSDYPLLFDRHYQPKTIINTIGSR